MVKVSSGYKAMVRERDIVLEMRDTVTVVVASSNMYTAPFSLSSIGEPIQTLMMDKIFMFGKPIQTLVWYGKREYE